MNDTDFHKLMRFCFVLAHTKKLENISIAWEELAKCRPGAADKCVPGFDLACVKNLRRKHTPKWRDDDQSYTRNDQRIMLIQSTNHRAGNRAQGHGKSDESADQPLPAVMRAQVAGDDGCFPNQ